MTFILKDFKQLKSHYANNIDIFLKSKEMDSIDQLENARKYQAQFLAAVINELSTRNINDKIKSTILYGAMLLIVQDIEDSLKIKSDLRNGLYKAMDISEGKNPSTFQLAECYRNLNNFLNLVFVDQDSRKGINPSNIFKNVGIKNLVSLLTKSYKKEQITHDSEIAQLKPETKTNANISNYKPLKEIPASAIAFVPHWAELLNGYNELKKHEFSKKHVYAIEDLSPERIPQLMFFEALIANLSSNKCVLNSDAKIAILSGAMYLVRKQISDDYSLRSSQNSEVYKELSKILNADEAKPEDIEALIQAANHFIRFMTIDQIITKEGPKNTYRIKHIFSDIKGFDLSKALTLMNDMISSNRISSLNSCESKIPEEDQQLSSSIFSGWSLFRGASPSKKPEPVDEDKELLLSLGLNK